MQFIGKTAIAWYCLLLLAALGACTGTESTDTVTVEITGLGSGADSDAVFAMLKTMYDKDAAYQRMQSRFVGEQLTVEMSPVSDIDVFARNIRFGTVTAVTGRTIKVRYLKPGSTIRV